MSASFSGRLGRALGNLFLALINATLILLALCLFLGLRLAGTVERVSERAGSFAVEQIAQLAPYRDGLDDLTQEIGALRSDLAGLREAGGEGTARLSGQIEARLARLDSQVDALEGALGPALEKTRSALEHPELVVDRAVQAAVDRSGVWIAGLVGCALPEAPSGAPEQARGGIAFLPTSGSG